MIDDDRQQLENEVTRYLRASTRGGVHASTSRRSPTGLLGTERLDVALIEQVIDTQSPKNVDHFVNELYKHRVDISALEPAALLKLRAMLLLGLGEAQHLTSDERRDAFARTYRKYRASGTVAAQGVSQFRERYSEVRRAEREDLIARIARLVTKELSDTRPSAPPARNTLPWEFEIAEGRDEYIYPARAEGNELTVIRSRTVRSTTPALAEYRQTYTDRSPGGALPHIQNIGQGNLRMENLRPYEEDGTPGYRYDVVITFPPVPHGKTVDIAWILTHRFTAENQWKPGHKRFARLTPVTAVDKFMIGVRFTEPETPTEIWRLDNISPQNALEPSSRGAPIDIIQGRAEAAWENLVLGRTCGIVWHWPDQVK